MRFKSCFVLSIVSILVFASALEGSSGRWQIAGTIYGPPGRNFVDPTGITFDGTYIWAIEQHAPTTGTPLYRINPATMTVEAEYLLGVSSNSVQGLAWDGQYIWISGDGFRIHRFDPMTAFLEEVCARPSNPQVTGMGAIGDTLICTGWYGGVQKDDIIMLDPNDCSYHVAAHLTTTGTHGIAWDGTHLLVCGHTDEQAAMEKTLFRYEITGNLVEVFEPFDFHAYDLAWDGEYLWVCDYGGQFDADGRIYKVRLLEPPPLEFAIRIYEQTGSINTYSFSWNDGRLYSQIAGDPGPQSLGYGGYDFGTGGCEYYDVYISDAAGNLLALQPGDAFPGILYLTIECMDLSCNTWLPVPAPSWPGAGNNLDAVVLEFPDSIYFGEEIVQVEYGLCDEPFSAKTSNFAENALGPPDGGITKMGGGISTITMRLGPTVPEPPDTELQHDPMFSNTHPYFMWLERDVSWHSQNGGYISAAYNSSWHAGVISLRDFDSAEMPGMICRIFQHADSSNFIFGYTSTVPDESDFHFSNVDLGIYIHSTGSIRPAWNVYDTGLWSRNLAEGYYDIMISIDGASDAVSFFIWNVSNFDSPLDVTSPPLWSAVESRSIAGRYNIQINTFNMPSHLFDVWSTDGPQLPGVEPLITSIEDVENDQGRRVRIKWNASYYDSLGSPKPITSYAVWRRIDELPRGMEGLYPPGEWDFVTAVPACCEKTYATIVETLADSTIRHGMHYSALFVRALTDVPGRYYDSPVDSGYSVDNVAPEPPAGVAGVQDEQGLRITWEACHDEDFWHYELYRGTTEHLTADDLLAVINECEFIDAEWTPGNNVYYYKICSVDASGNASGHALLAPQDAVATLLQGFSAGFDGTCIEIVWCLDEYDEGVTFIIMRSDDNDATFEALDGAPERENLVFTFRDTSVEHGKSYRYRVEHSDGITRTALFETEPIATPALPLTLYQNHPNPFNPSTTIRYYLPVSTDVLLDVYDVTGRLVTRLVENERQQGHKAALWDGRDQNGNEVNSGMYFYRLRAGKQIYTRKMILLR